MMWLLFTTSQFKSRNPSVQPITPPFTPALYFLSTNLILSFRNLDLIFDLIRSFEPQYKNQNHKNQVQSPFAPLKTVSTLKSSLSLSNLEKVLHISRLLSLPLLSLGSSGPQLSEWVVGPVWANLPSEAFLGLPKSKLRTEDDCASPLSSHWPGQTGEISVFL